jgi:nucleoside-diphosphate-sugar epimerase
MKIGVIGCNGFIGRNILEQYKWIPITREDVNLLDKKSVEKYFDRYFFSVIIHCAVTGGSRLHEDTSDVLRDNILMFENVANVFHGKLIYFSSGAALRGNPPSDPYGLSKWIIDKRILQLENVYSLRIWGCYGPGELSTRFSAICKDKGHVVIDKDRYFDFVDVNDVIKVVYEYTIGHRTSKVCNLVYRERLKLSDWAKKFGATYDIVDKTELGESYACKDDFRRDLSFKEYN